MQTRPGHWLSRWGGWLGLLGLGLGLAACQAAQPGGLIYTAEQRTASGEIHRQTFLSDGGGQTAARPAFAAAAYLGGRWLPDGRQLVARQAADKNMYVLDLATGEQSACLTCGLTGVREVVPAPRGAQAVIRTKTALYRVTLAGLDRQLLAEVAGPYGVSWAPDGRSLVFMDGGGLGHIWRLDIEGAQLTDLSPAGEGGFAPQWSPAGDQIAFVSTAAGIRTLKRMDRNGGSVVTVTGWAYAGDTFDPGLWWPPQWSPDGAQLAFVSAAETGDLDIFVVNVDGSGRRNLTRAPGGDDNYPVWAPDGKRIAFVSERDGQAEVYVMQADGRQPVNLSRSPDWAENYPAWRPQPADRGGIIWVGVGAGVIGLTIGVWLWRRRFK